MQDLTIRSETDKFPSSFRFLQKPVEKKKASSVSLLLCSHFLPSSPLPSRRKNRGFPSNSADNPRACERAVISKSTAINKRDKSPRSIFHRRAILSSGAARVPCRLASILRSLTLSLPSSILAKSSPRFFRSKPPRDTLNHSPRRNLEFSCEEKKKKKKNNRPFPRIDTNGITDEEDLSNHVSRPTWLYFST